MNESIREKALGICEILYNKKGIDIVAIHVADKTIIADWFVICSGRAIMQTKALCEELSGFKYEDCFAHNNVGFQDGSVTPAE